jgi:predicted DNA-binding transcriptional regulator AlpA
MMQDTNSPFQAVDTRTAAEMLGVSKSHLEKLRIDDSNASPPTIRVGRCVRYPVSQLIAWAEEQAR